MIENLNETVEMMNSSDYKERFKAEYYQLEYRTKKLIKMLDDWTYGNLNFEPKCSYDLLEAQAVYMQEYKRLLELRAEKEGIVL